MKVRYEKRPVSDIHPDPSNPRTIKPLAKKALAASVRRFGLVQPIILNEKTGRVVGGHQRLEVLKEQGVSEVDVAVGSWTEEEERALSVSLNNPDAQGEFSNGVRDYLSKSLRGLSIDDFQALRLDGLVLKPADRDKNSHNRRLEYKLVVTATDESHQAELLDRFEAEGLEVKLLIV